ncbi:carbon-nitrogen hydrolase family protein [bacterium]|nr:carbon-nitrogen hydrolase family protein [bacterium]
MSQKVTISNISMAPPRTDTTRTIQEIVEGMISHIGYKLENVLPNRPDLIVLPEHCDTPANLNEKMSKEYDEVKGEQFLNFFKDISKKYNTYIAYSAGRKDKNGDWRNSTVIIDRTGGIAGEYNKNHLVITENTRDKTLYGTEAPIIQCDFGTVACVICFDLNFTDLLYKYAKLRPDILIFSSAYHGGLMQAYWAYACRAYFVGALKGGLGTILSPVGNIVASTTNYYDFVTATVNLDCCLVHISGHSSKFRAMKKKYGEGVTVYDPGHLGCVLIANNIEGITIKDIIQEFDIELLDQYFARSLKHRNENTK